MADLNHQPPSQCTCPSPTHTAAAANQPFDGTRALKVVAGVAAVALGAPAIVTACAAVALPAIGFTPGGVAAGSIAAFLQSTIYGGATGGLFSALQSIGATIAAPAAAEVAAATGLIAAGNALIRGDDCECIDCVCDNSCRCRCRSVAQN